MRSRDRSETWSAAYGERRTTSPLSSNAGELINAGDKEFLSDKPADPAELLKAADRAGAVVSDQIRSIVEAAQTRADEIRSTAERDAQRTRQEAREAARKVRERIDAIEGPLGELVASLRREADKVGGELAAAATDVTPGTATEEGAALEPPAADAEAEEEPLEDEGAVPGKVPEQAEPEAAEEPPPKDEAAAEEKAAEKEVAEEAPEEVAEEPQAEEPAEVAEEPQAEEPAEVAEEPQAEEPQAEEPPAEEAREEEEGEPEATEAGASEDQGDEEGKEAEATPRRGVLSRLRRRRPFITAPGQCAVCGREFMAGSEDELQASGWRVNDDVGLCPECQSEGWELPEGAGTPSRPAAQEP